MLLFNAHHTICHFTKSIDIDEIGIWKSYLNNDFLIVRDLCHGTKMSRLTSWKETDGCVSFCLTYTAWPRKCTIQIVKYYVIQWK